MKTRKSVGVVLLSAIALLLSFGAAGAQSTVNWSCAETLLTIPEGSFVKNAETDGFSASITYTTPAGAEKLLALSLDYSFRYVYGLHVYGDVWEGPYYENGPFVYIPSGSLVLKDGTYYMKSTTSSRITYLKGKWVKEFQALRLECDYSPGSGWYYAHWGTQWQVKANASGTPPEVQPVQPPEPGGGGGGQQPAEPIEFEGRIDTIGTASVTLNKEGTLLQLATTSQTLVTLNGQTATLGDLLVGDKAKAMYDPNTNEAYELKIER